MKKQELKKANKMSRLLVDTRIKTLGILCEKDTCVCQLVKRLDVKHSLISHHLRILCDMGYVKQKRNGRHVVYGLVYSKRPIIDEIFNLISKV